MRLITTDEMVKITLDLFSQYIEPLACSFMYGEVPTSTIMIHRSGNYDNGWHTKVHFKNTISISIFRCEIYLHDIMSMCRDCKMYLIDTSVFRISILFSMMYSLYQTQFMDFKNAGVVKGYDTMINEAAHETYEFIQKHYDFNNELEKIILDTIYYHNMRVNQLWKYFPDIEPYVLFAELYDKYKQCMKRLYPDAYKTACSRKSKDYLINIDGFILLERVSLGTITYEQEPDTEDLLNKAPEFNIEEINNLSNMKGM